MKKTAYIKKTDNPKMGRPTNSPKLTQIAVRLDNETLKKLDAIADNCAETRVQALRHGIDYLYFSLFEDK